jgi:catechol 2,3-dioxygenase-like lactoylglutathione lyase family enzyme
MAFSPVPASCRDLQAGSLRSPEILRARKECFLFPTNRVMRFRVVSVVFVLSLSSSLAALSTFAESPKIAVESIGMTVSDMDRAVEFYSALTFQKVSDVEVFGDEFEHLEGVFGARMRIVRMQLGNEYLDLTQYLALPGRPIPADSRSNDLWFQHAAIVVRDMDQAFEKLRALKVQFVSTGPQTLPPSIKAAAGIKAFYFRDPDQHNLEVIYFPPGKGDPRWQEKTDKLFLGIDHTAIGISNTDASLKFYRDLLGMRKAGESENFGTEQEHLNQVFGAHLRITGMRASSGPGIEFLEYLTPRDGRPLPADVHANDIVHWQTMIATNDLDLLAKKLRDAHVRVISPGIVTIPKEKAGFSRGALVSDPDGHSVLLVQE